MAHAVVMQVNLEGFDPAAGQKMLEEMVIPNAKSQPGFQSGTWLRAADGTGTGIVVFDTEANAQKAEPALQPPPDGPKVLSCAVFSIEAEA
jgi:hypothetical protein